MRSSIPLLVALVLGVTAPAAPAGPIATTAGGPVEGVVVGSSAQWRGIPYAAPPVGALRGRPPQAAAPWSGVLDASQFAQPCAQPADADRDGNIIAVAGS